MSSWLSAGATVVWVADPRDASGTVREPGQPPRRLGASDVLDAAPLLPGFQLPVADVFAL